MMDEQILGAQEDFQMSVQNSSSSPQERYFDQIVMNLQQVILDLQFQSAQTQFMRANCGADIKSSAQMQQLFLNYKKTIAPLLNQKIVKSIPNFNLTVFMSQLEKRKQQVDEQIVQILLSLADLQSFKSMLSDYKTAEEEEQRYRVLTIKTNKMPENKKVKSNAQNIFGSNNTPLFNSKNMAKKSSTKVLQKTLEQVFVPETVLTIKGLRKC